MEKIKQALPAGGPPHLRGAYTNQSPLREISALDLRENVECEVQVIRRDEPQLESHERATSTAMMAPPANTAPTLMPFARIVAIACIAFGVAGLTSWWFGEPLFPAWLHGGVLKPNTAFSFVLAGLSLAGLAAHARQESGVAASSLLVSLQPMAALLLLIFAGTTLVSHALDLPIGIDKLLVPDDAHNPLPVFPWRMSPISAVGFSVLALAMMPWPL